MEVLESGKGKIVPLTTKKNCSKKYVQPLRVESFAPKRTYCSAEKPLETVTTYHSSYYNENQASEARPKPFKPVQNLNVSGDKFTDATTVKLSFKPICGIYKAKPIRPRNRLNPNQSPMESITTIKSDFSKKVISKPELIIPRGNIRLCKAAFDGKTTTLLSYIKPETMEPMISFKPQLKYCQPVEPTAKETTQKLSYLPYEVVRKENYPWAQKPIYRPPKLSMPGETTYGKSYLKTEPRKEPPVLPRDAGVFLPSSEHGGFSESTVYKESFVPCENEPVIPVLPRPNLLLSDKKMLCDSTNKLSFQPVKGEKRKPILPRSQNRLLNGCTDGPACQRTTTNRMEFTLKIAKRPEPALPCGQIHTSNQPLDAATTTNLSYVNPGPVAPQLNFKPSLKYCAPEEKVQDNTVSKLSYPQWPVGKKEAIPWAEKARYQRPDDKMSTDTVYHSSFPPPGYFVDEVCECPVTD